ncbi:MAG: endolytic transglycosylase MltG [Patescibacteria group bacterium]|nr:endolytic transglycosylase MltG [Patescibacteria group bacterium]
MNNTKFKIIGLIVLFTTAAFCLFLYFQLFVPPKSSANEKIDIVISKGMGVDDIAEELVSKGIIRSSWAFEIYSLISRKVASFQHGNYELNANQTVPQLVKTLSTGPQSVEATIIPGMSLKEVDDYLSSLKIISKGNLASYDITPLKNKHPFLKSALSLEGYMFPDTYQFFMNSDTGVVVEKILSNFQYKVLTRLTDQSFFVNNKSNDWLIIASMLEREVINQQDKRIVAGILKKRIKAEMPLQIDATVIYSKCQGRYDCAIGLDDFKINSAYNTYKNLGLPPTSISNPNIDSITASLEPVETNYWFYLSDPKTKKTIFSETLDEHNRNRVKYKIIE